MIRDIIWYIKENMVLLFMGMLFAALVLEEVINKIDRWRIKHGRN